MFRGNRWQRTCNRHNYLGIFPLTGHAAGEGTPNNDSPYFIALIKWVMSRYAVDERRVYLVGFSGGCRRSYWMAAQYPSMITAIGVASGKIGHKEDAPDLYTPKASDPPVSILHIHGELDTRVPLKGGVFTDGEGRKKMVLPTKRAIDIWSTHIGGKLVEPSIPKGAPNHVRTVEYRAASGHRVMAIFDDKLGHKWAKDYANEVILRFFESIPVAR